METWLSIVLGVAGLLQGSPEPVSAQQASSWTSVATAFVVGLPATIAAIVAGMALLQSRRNAEVAAKTDAAVTTNIQKTDAIIDQTTKIHTLTNSNLSKVQAQLEVSNKTIEGLNKAQAESARRMASMERLITSLIPTRSQQASSQADSEKLDSLKTMLSDVQHGTPPIPVHDEAVLNKLTVIADKTDKKLDTIQESADVAAQQTDKSKDSKGS